MLIHYEENVDEIPHACKKPASTLVVYTPAIPQEHKELVYFRENNFDVRREHSARYADTHSQGALRGRHSRQDNDINDVCHIMHQSSIDCNAFLGGISKNYGTNYILSEKSDYVVIEADEFDRSFHWLRPWMSVITSTD